MDQSLTANPLITNLGIRAHLEGRDIAALEAAITAPVTAPAGKDLICEGDRPDRVHLICDGLACRYKVLADGSRQIPAWLIPGDICDLHVAILGHLDHGIAPLSTCQVSYIARSDVENLIRDHPALNRALVEYAGG